MNFDWLEFRKTAIYLAVTSIPDIYEEAALRIAISRAYYAAFNIARWYLFNVEETAIPPVSAHTALINPFNQSRRVTDKHRAIATKLFQLKRLRETADYERASLADPKAFWRQAAKLSSEIIGLVESL